MLRVLPPPLPLLPLSASSLRSSSSSLSKQLPALLPLLVVVVRYYFLRLLFFFPFCLHAGVREAERNEGTRSVSAYSTRSFLSASCVLRPREREREKNVASIGIARNRKEFDFLKSMIFGSREKRLLRFLFLVRSSTLAVVPRMRLLRLLRGRRSGEIRESISRGS